MNYTRAKLQGSKTLSGTSTVIALNYTRAKLQGSKTSIIFFEGFFMNYTRAKMQGSKTELLTRRLKALTTPVQNCRGLKQSKLFFSSSK